MRTLRSLVGLALISWSGWEAWSAFALPGSLPFSSGDALADLFALGPQATSGLSAVIGAATMVIGVALLTRLGDRL